MVREADSTGSAADFFPRRITLPTLAAAAQGCRGCGLYKHAAQAVFGEGPAHAPLMLIGEQPGDQEDLAGKPFVGPSGAMLNKALEAAGIDRAAVYVTNAVKHFKFEPRGKRRLHAKPTWTEMMACRPWLIEELRLLMPHVVVCLGATAAQSLLGKTFRLTQHRGEFVRSPMEDLPPHMQILATVHPSSLLRIPDREARHRAQQEFQDDLALAARRIRRNQSRREAVNK
jgi:uracil-DNA glycosylase family protein